jgi:uncharacterized protein involved in exopolysaccharide biosynthesis
MANFTMEEISTRTIVEVLLRHKKKIVLLPLLAIGCGVLVLLFFPRQYRSEARIFLRVGRESVGLDPTATTGQTIPLQQSDRKDEVVSAVELLSSQSVAAQVVDQLGADVVLGHAQVDAEEPSFVAEYLGAPLRAFKEMIDRIDPISDRERAIIHLGRRIDVRAEPDSTILTLGYDARTPQLAQQVCEALVNVYRQEHIRIHRNEESRPFFAEQQERLRQQLDEALEAVRSAKNEYGLSDIDERRKTLESQFGAVELDRLTTEQQLAGAEARIADLERQIASLPERLVASKRSVPNQGADLLRQQLFALQVKSMDLASRYSESHPMVQAVNNQLAEAKTILAEQADERVETTDDLNPIHRALLLELKREQIVVAGYKARQTELGHQKEAILVDLRALNESEVAMDRLSRRAELARDKFMQYSHNFEEALIDSALESERISNLSIVQPATFSERPVSPSRLIVALGTMVLAFAGTAALVLYSERLNDRLSSAEDVEQALGLPVLGSIPGRKAQRSVLPLNTNGRNRSVVLSDRN